MASIASNHGHAIGRPLVSIITVVFNGAATLERTIRSVLGQTYQPIEYLIIDGGSTDGTIDIIRRYQADLAHWSSGPDAGIYDAMNIGISQCRGEIIGIINADDWYDAAAVALAVDASRKHPDAQVFHGEVSYVASRQGHTDRLRPRLDSRALEREMSILHPTCFVRAETYRAFGGFEVRYTIAADYELMFRWYRRGVQFRFVPGLRVFMQDSGASDVRGERANAESRDIKIAHGVSRFSAYSYYYYIWLVLAAKRLIEHTSLRFLIHLRRDAVSRLIGLVNIAHRWRGRGSK
jgi:glycosyltransferase involved in cell wall biosynthesis